MINHPWFIFDTESIGLYGQAFAVAGVIMLHGEIVHEFCHACLPYMASGQHDDRKWVEDNVPTIEDNHRSPIYMRDAFWKEWVDAYKKYPEIKVAADCLYPVEAKFFAECVKDNETLRKFGGPYPFYDIASFMLAAGMDPLETYPRLANETPAHHPLNDARQSARLLKEALTILTQTHTQQCQ